MTIRYTLDAQGEPVPCPDLMTWAHFMEDDTARRVAADEIGDARVSTVFLGLDHNFMSVGPPILWETMVFGGTMNSYQMRYSSRGDALAGHAAVVDLVRHAMGPPH